MGNFLRPEDTSFIYGLLLSVLERISCVLLLGDQAALTVVKLILAHGQSSVG